VGRRIGECAKAKGNGEISECMEGILEILASVEGLEPLLTEIVDMMQLPSHGVSSKLETDENEIREEEKQERQMVAQKSEDGLGVEYSEEHDGQGYQNPLAVSSLQENTTAAKAETAGSGENEHKKRKTS